MKIETNNLTPVQTMPASEKGTFGKVASPLMDGKAVKQGENVAAQTPAGNNGVPELQPPGSNALEGVSSEMGDGQSINFQELFMWMATMASEYIKQQAELLKTRQKSVEGGYQASLDSAQSNFAKNMSTAIVGIASSAVTLVGSTVSALQLGKIDQSLPDLDKQQLTTNANLYLQSSSSLGKIIESGGGIYGASKELDAKKQEALAGLINKTTESISNNEAATRQILEKFSNDLVATLKNFYASTTR